ncbi:hypothetical protein JCM10207_008483 [Rhodosporidiobolus poonsookiae]
MDFGDAVHKALAQRQRSPGAAKDAPPTSTPPDNGSESTSKRKPPSLSLLMVNGASSHPTSQGQTPAGSRNPSPAPPAAQFASRSPRPQTPTSPSRRASFNPFFARHGPLSPHAHGHAHDSTSPTSNSSSPTQSRSPSRRTTLDDTLFPPPIVLPGPGGREGLGADTPRPKHRSQASFDWFGDAFAREAAAQQAGLPSSLDGPLFNVQGGIPPYLLGGGGGEGSSSSSAARMRRTDSPARMDLSRSSSISTSAGDAASLSGQGKSKKAKNGQGKGKGKASAGWTSGTGTDQHLTEESEWEDDAAAGGAARSPVSPTSGASGRAFIGLSGSGTATPPLQTGSQRRQGSGDTTDSPGGGQDPPKSALRGAFTASDLERGARRLRGEDDLPSSSGGGGSASSSKDRDRSDWKRRASAFPAVLRPSTKTSKKSASASGGANRLSRPMSAGAAEGPGGGVPTPGLSAPDHPSNDGRARSVHGGEDEGWEDEVRDRFDADAPAGASARPQVGSRKGSSLWAGLSLPHSRVGGGGSGTSTPRGDGAVSEDEGAAGAGTPRRPPSAQRRGSAWGVVRDRLKGKKKKEAQGASLTGHELVTELATGVLPLVLIKMAVLDRDERGDRRIPILMNYLKLRITDSIYPFHDKHAIFRIELEYGDGAVKWVIYRELKDFVNLHAHYRVANLRQGIDKFPTFPKTSLPYLNWLKSERGGKGGVGKAEFAKAQREALENYLLKLIKATMFGPGANRLCKFLEISAMSIMLTTRGGEQGKQGYLRITSSGASRKKQPGFHPLDWKRRHDPKWFIVRDSYIVAVDDPASTEVYDVIMVDSTFEIERPTRVYRKGLNLLHPDHSSDSLTGDADPTLREGAADLLADARRPQGHRGAGDPNDPSSSKHKPFGGMGGKGAGTLPEGDEEKGAAHGGDKDGEGDGAGEKSLPEKLGAAAGSVRAHAGRKGTDEEKRLDNAAAATASGGPGAEGEGENDDLSRTSNHTFYLRSSERKLRLVAKTERQQDQFIASIEKMLAKTIWAGRNRFDSFAPIRLNVAAQWLIDGRDYFWSLSRAIALAKHKIYIHDWWLSPELYLRRPPIENEKWRLDRLLQRKAREGVQIFVIVYKEVSNDFTPVESGYTKTRLRGLHPNIHVQRSPSHTSTGTLLWSHHEKMCVIDETIGFMGGLDLCFGRWDTPGHVLIDDGPNLLNTDDPQNIDRDQAMQSQIWPGKDYSNQRVLDFHTLSKPDEDMYDRGKVPRQPWHDIGLQIIGQPARDLCRHFIQRWNYLLRIKNHTVKMPFLLPAPDFTPQQLQEQRITGTCEVQICRSIGPWSMGVSHIEHSIQNAYIKAIQLSDHFVYIENQFFVTSTEVEGTIIENKIGDALVSRIVRAHSEGTPWRAIIIVPTVPGYPYPLDHSEASSVRLIMECQYASICRGERSIFARLRREGVDPDEYISFFGLRAWGKLSSGALTTESTYIHAKGMVVDDRIAIIGSANINERSQRGDRDSELACIIRDTDMIDSTMGGKPYKVGRFAHTMRVRLMREHLGIDVDELEAAEGKEELEAREATDLQEKEDEWDPDNEQSHGTNRGAQAGKTLHFVESAAGSAKQYAGHTVKGATEAAMLSAEKAGHRVKRNLNVETDEAENKPAEAIDADEETNADKLVRGEKGTAGFASTVVPTLEEKVMAEGRPQGNIRDGSIREMRQQAEREREDGPATQPPFASQDRDEADQANDSQRKSGAKEVDESVDARHDSSSSSEENGKNDRDVNSGQDRLGDKTTQSAEIDDTRKIDMQGDGVSKDAAPLSPIDEDGDEHSGDAKIGPAPPSNDAAPPDIAKAQHHGHREHGRASDRKSSLPRTTSQSKGNEQAVNRNTITNSLRRNLRERGAYTIPTPAPKIDAYGFSDPLVDSFYKDVWLAAAVRNTQIYRKVFRCMPDDLVQTWKQYREFQNWAERHNKAPKDVVPSGDQPPHSDPAGHSGQHGAGGGGSAGGVIGQGANEGGETIEQSNKHHPIAGSTAPGNSGIGQAPGGKEARDYTQRAADFAKEGSANGPATEKPANGNGHGGGEEELEREKQGKSTITRRARGWTVVGQDDAPNSASSASGSGASAAGNGGEKKGRGRGATVSQGGDRAKGEGEHDEAFPDEEREQMEQLLEEVTGQLIVFPTRFLEAESAGGNFLFSKDRIPPMAIYD